MDSYITAQTKFPLGTVFKFQPAVDIDPRAIKLADTSYKKLRRFRHAQGVSSFLRIYKEDADGKEIDFYDTDGNRLPPTPFGAVRRWLLLIYLDFRRWKRWHRAKPWCLVS